MHLENTESKEENHKCRKCNSQRLDGFDLCRNHKCRASSCSAERYSGSGEGYCTTHHREYMLGNIPR